MNPSTFVAVINQLLPEPHASLLSGILFGVRRSMPHDFYQALIATGTLHVIALSGTNITILINLLAAVTIKPFGRRLSSVLTIVCIVLFILFVGPSPSVVRAGLMGGLSLIAIYTGRWSWSLLSLILASFIMILIRPDWLSDISFQLSFAASLGIILFGSQHKSSQKLLTHKNAYGNNLSVYSVTEPQKAKPVVHTLLDAVILFTISKYKEIYQEILNDLKAELRLTLSAQLFTVPLILWKFHQFSLISPLTNILIGWIVPFITVLGIMVVLSGWLWLPLGIIPAWLVWVPLEYFIKIVELTASLPFASFKF